MEKLIKTKYDVGDILSIDGIEAEIINVSVSIICMRKFLEIDIRICFMDGRLYQESKLPKSTKLISKKVV